MRLPTPRERQTQRFLGAGLADGAGDRDDICSRAHARCPRQVAQAFQDVGNDDERRVLLMHSGAFTKFVGRLDLELTDDANFINEAYGKPANSD